GRRPATASGTPREQTGRPSSEPGRTGGGELFVGTASVFADAGFTEVSNPTPRRVVMRVEL
ncbi:hypothetical protein AB0H87_30325, partial [Asanoa sp. NPDC050611]